MENLKKGFFSLWQRQFSFSFSCKKGNDIFLIFLCEKQKGNLYVKSYLILKTRSKVNTYEWQNPQIPVKSLLECCFIYIILLIT